MFSPTAFGTETGRALGAVALLVTLAAASCGPPSDAPAELRTSESDRAGVVVVAITGAVDALPLLALSPVPVTEISGDAPPFLGSVGEVEVLGDGGLLVEDNQSDELRRFDASGTEVALLGGAGEGPGEFQNLTELSVTTGDTAYAYDRRSYRLTRFDPDGSLGGTTPLGRERAGTGSLVEDAWPLDSERFVLLSLGAGSNDFTGGSAFRDQRDAVLHLVDATGEELRAPSSSREATASRAASATRGARSRTIRSCRSPADVFCTVRASTTRSS